MPWRLLERTQHQWITHTLLFRCTTCCVQGEPEPQQPDEPRRLGYKLFNTGKDAADYYRNLVNKLTKNQDLNEVCPCCAPLASPQWRMQNC